MPKLGPGTTCSGNDQCMSGICDVAGSGNCCTATCSWWSLRGDLLRRLGRVRLPQWKLRGGLLQPGEQPVHPRGYVQRLGELHLARRGVLGALDVREHDVVPAQCSVTGTAPTGTSVGCVAGFYCDTVPSTPTCS